MASLTKNECKDCLHFEVCAYAAHDLPICDLFLKRDIVDKVVPVRNIHSKRFIVLTNQDLDDIKAGRTVKCESCDFSYNGESFDIFFVSEKWHLQHIAVEDLPFSRNLHTIL